MTAPMTSRVPPLDISDLDPETTAVLGGINFGRRRQPMNAFLTLANQPEFFSRFLPYGIHTNWSSLPPRERELLILRVSCHCRSDYEIVQHTSVGRAAGLTDEELERVVRLDSTDGWGPDDLVLVASVDELCTQHDLSDEHWDALNERWSRRFVMDMVLTVGLYVLSCMALNAFRVQPEEET